MQRLRLSTPAIGGAGADAHRHATATPNYVPISALSRPTNGVYASDPQSQLITVNLLRRVEGFGFRLIGGMEMGMALQVSAQKPFASLFKNIGLRELQVGSIIRNGAAFHDGRLREGDSILEVDGHNVADGRHDVAVNLIQQAAKLGHVKLVVRRQKGEQSKGRSSGRGGEGEGAR